MTRARAFQPRAFAGRRFASNVALAAALAGTSYATSAQPVPDGITSAQFADRRVVDAFAECVVAKHQSDAATYVLNSYTDWRDAPLSTPSELKDRRCIPPDASSQDASFLPNLSENAIKVALAGALVRRELPTFNAAVIKTAKALPSATLVDRLFPPEGCKKCNTERKAKFEDARVKLNNVMAPIIFGECAVRADPMNAHALIMSSPASAEETASFAALGEAFSDCLAKGSQFTATRSMLRGVLAISYYRLAHAPRVELAGAPK
jgi:hypothetical protein